MTNIHGIEWDTSNSWEGVVVSKPQCWPHVCDDLRRFGWPNFANNTSKGLVIVY